MARKVFISFLGTNNYIETIYDFADGKQSDSVRFIQEALIRHDCLTWGQEDKIFIFCTADAERLNWEDNGQSNAQSEIETIGLERRLKKLLDDKFVLMVEKISIPEGFSEQEIWNIFDIVYQKLEEGDEIYFDVTHAFRSIPLFSTVLFNYAHFMKNTNIVSIKYGAFEKLGPAYKVKTMPLEGRIASVIDLTSISDLQRWTEAVNQFVSFGRVDKINELHLPILNNRTRQSSGTDKDAIALRKFSNTFDTFSKQLITCQGKDLISAKESELLKQQLNAIKNIKNVLHTFKPLLEKFEQAVAPFKPDCISNAIEAAKCCFENKEYQQAITLLQEGLITEIAYLQQLDWSSIEDRELVSNALNIICQKIDRNKWKEPKSKKWQENIELYFTKIEGIVESDRAKEISVVYTSLTEIRNQYSHGGMLALKKFDANKIIEKIEDIFNKFNNLPSVSYSDSEPCHSMLLNLSNHPLAIWSEAQLNAARQQFGEIQDLPFPQIAPDATEQNIQELAEQYFKNIKNIGTPQQVTVHVMGELTFCFALVQLLKQNGYTCVASTTQRLVQQVDNNTKQATFQFVKFRKY